MSQKWHQSNIKPMWKKATIDQKQPSSIFALSETSPNLYKKLLTTKFCLHKCKSSNMTNFFLMHYPWPKKNHKIQIWTLSSPRKWCPHVSHRWFVLVGHCSRKQLSSVQPGTLANLSNHPTNTQCIVKKPFLRVQITQSLKKKRKLDENCFFLPSDPPLAWVINIWMQVTWKAWQKKLTRTLWFFLWDFSCISQDARWILRVIGFLGW